MQSRFLPELKSGFYPRTAYSYIGPAPKRGDYLPRRRDQYLIWLPGPLMKLEHAGSSDVTLSNSIMTIV